MDKLRRCGAFLLDMDGTLNLGDAPLPGAVEFLRTLERLGKQYIYLTNNSSRSSGDYVRRMRGMGFPCTRENVLTSGEAAGAYLRAHYPGRPVYLLGTRALAGELEAMGLELRFSPESLVLVGFDRELCYEKLERAVHLLRRGAPFIAANPDLVCPMPGDEALPDCGSICALLTAATGARPLYMGKPEPRIIHMAAARLCLPPEALCCVGDRLYTDMAAARNAAALGVLVLSGETTAELLVSSAQRPDYVFRDVAALAAALEDEGTVYPTGKNG